MPTRISPAMARKQPRAHPADAVDYACELYLLGLCLREVADQTGINRETIRKSLVAKGLTRTRHESRGTMDHRLRLRIAPPDVNGCWPWVGQINNKGYGMFGGMAAHRAVYMHLRGPIPDGKECCHACDNPSCVNPDHIWFGTRADNMRDASVKGRLRRGEDNPQAKLTEAVVREIKSRHVAGAAQRQIARDLGVDYRRVNAIVLGRSWGWLA